MKFLILAHSWDASSARVMAALRRRHPPNECRLVTLEELTLAPTWAHRVGAGTTFSEVILHDGCVLRSDETGVVFNRLSAFDLPQFGEQDRAYAVAEMSALLASWMEGFECPVINPATPQSFFSGRSHLRWLALAAQAGLPLPRIRLTSNLRRFPADGLHPVDMSNHSATPSLTTRDFAFLTERPEPATHFILLAGNEICGELPPQLAPACRAFAQRVGAHVLKLHFTSDSGNSPQWTFSHADSSPDLNMTEASATVRLLERIFDKAQSIGALI